MSIKNESNRFDCLLINDWKHNFLIFSKLLLWNRVIEIAIFITNVKCAIYVKIFSHEAKPKLTNIVWAKFELRFITALLKLWIFKVSTLRPKYLVTFSETFKAYNFQTPWSVCSFWLTTFSCLSVLYHLLFFHW